MLKDRLMKFLKLDGLIENLSGYVETRVELLKVEVKEELASLLSKALFGLLIALTVTFFLLFVSLSAAFAVGEKWGTPIGFSLVGAFYLLIAVLFYLFKDSLNARLEKLITELLQKKNK
jgi:uncharacterized membrane protein YqjE